MAEQNIQNIEDVNYLRPLQQEGKISQEM